MPRREGNAGCRTQRAAEAELSRSHQTCPGHSGISAPDPTRSRPDPPDNLVIPYGGLNEAIDQPKLVDTSSQRMKVKPAAGCDPDQPHIALSCAGSGYSRSLGPAFFRLCRAGHYRPFIARMGYLVDPAPVVVQRCDQRRRCPRKHVGPPVTRSGRSAIRSRRGWLPGS